MVILTWLALSFAVAIYAGNKGRSALGYFLASIVLSPLLGFIFAAVSRPLATSETKLHVETKQCPDCMESLNVEARICRFCRYEFAPAVELPAAAEMFEDVEPADPPSLWSNIAGLLGAAWGHVTRAHPVAQAGLLFLALYVGYEVFKPFVTDSPASRIESESRRTAARTEGDARHEQGMDLLHDRMKVIADEAEFIRSVELEGQSVLNVHLTERVSTYEAQEMANMVALVFAKEREKIFSFSSVTVRMQFNGYVLATARANTNGLRE